MAYSDTELALSAVYSKTKAGALSLEQFLEETKKLFAQSAETKSTVKELEWKTHFQRTAHRYGMSVSDIGKTVKGATIPGGEAVIMGAIPHARRAEIVLKSVNGKLGRADGSLVAQLLGLSKTNPVKKVNLLEPMKVGDDLPAEQLEKLVDLASQLSPENLSCDGELSITKIRQRAASIGAQWVAIEKQLGFKVSEEQVWAAHSLN